MRGMLTAPQLLPAQAEATRTGHELCAFFLSGLFQWNVTWMRPLVSAAMPSAVVLALAMAVGRTTTIGVTAIGIARHGCLLRMAVKLQGTCSPPPPCVGFAMCRAEPTTRYS